MVKIERRDTEKAKQALLSLADAKERGTTYNTEEVNNALREIFYGKCYICENKESSSYQIGHSLLKSVYYGETPQKMIEAKILRKRLRKEISRFKELVREYKEAEGEEKEDLEISLKRELKSSSEFAAFKRWLIKDNREYYSELCMNCAGEILFG